MMWRIRFTARFLGWTWVQTKDIGCVHFRHVKKLNGKSFIRMKTTCREIFLNGDVSNHIHKWEHLYGPPVLDARASETEQLGARKECIQAELLDLSSLANTMSKEKGKYVVVTDRKREIVRALGNKPSSPWCDVHSYEDLSRFDEDVVESKLGDVTYFIKPC